MKIRDVCLDYQHSFANNALTWTFPINIVDPVTEFKLHFRARNAACDDNDPWYWPHPLPYCIEEIAVIDGSEVIFALNGPEMIAMSCFDLGYMPFHRHNENPEATTHWCFPIHFGRDLTDPEWIFDPKKFRNPQIRITWDLAAIQPVGLGSFVDTATEAVQWSIWAKIMEEGARPRGYLMTKEIKEYTPTGVGDEITFLPVDFPHRKLMVRAYGFHGRMGQYVENLKLSQDQDKWIPFDLHGDDFIRLMKNWFTEVQIHGKHYTSNMEGREHMGGWLAHGVAVAAFGAFMCSVRGWASNTFEVELMDRTGVQPGTATRTAVWSMGMTRTPFDCFCYPFGDQDNPADWLQVAGMGNLRLILNHQAEWVPTTYGLTQIVCQQAHPY